MTTNTAIKTADERRKEEDRAYPIENFLRAEIAELRAALEAKQHAPDWRAIAEGHALESARLQAELDATLAQRAGSVKPVARLEQVIPPGGVMNGPALFDVVILDRDKCFDQLGLYAAPSAAVQPDSKLVERLTHERDALGQAIADAAMKVGIWNGEVPLTGPHLIMFANDLAECAKQQLDHGETMLHVQAALGCTDTGWISPDVILLRIEQLKASVDPSRKVPAWATPGTFKQPDSGKWFPNFSCYAIAGEEPKQVPGFLIAPGERVYIVSEDNKQQPDSGRDAARYRWLRSDDISVPSGQREINVYLERLPFREDQRDELLTGQEMDAAIDAAMAAQQGEQAPAAK